MSEALHVERRRRGRRIAIRGLLATVVGVIGLVVAAGIWVRANVCMCGPAHTDDAANTLSLIVGSVATLVTAFGSVAAGIGTVMMARAARVNMGGALTQPTGSPSSLLRFNPPPGWPPPPPNWIPPPGWYPHPTWPPAPPGWQFWSPGHDLTALSDSWQRETGETSP